MIDLQKIETFLKAVIEDGFFGHRVDEYSIKVELIEYSQMASHSDIRTNFVLDHEVVER